MEPKGKVAAILFVLLVRLLPVSVSAAESGGVEATVDQMSFTPAEPVMGGSVDISVMLFNTQSADAFNVEVAFYKDSISSTTSNLMSKSMLCLHAINTSTARIS